MEVLIFCPQTRSIKMAAHCLTIYHLYKHVTANNGPPDWAQSKKFDHTPSNILERIRTICKHTSNFTTWDRCKKHTGCGDSHFFRKEVFNGSYNFLLIIWKKAKCHKKRIFPGSGFNSLTGRSELLLGPSLDIFYTLP